ncbi:MAG: RNA polymerase sigma factor [Planctomycetota bacterium]|jgi:RNA polymerase sigma-70 factor (ECF subfamily)|nr:RNA polymerase sigma factor [Planctomycetota bacterium]
MLDPDAEDLQDVEKVLSGDREAFSRLVERHGQIVNQRMRSFSSDPRVSEELAHEVFVEAYLSLANYRRDAPFRYWLARIATFTGYRHWRDRNRRREKPLPDGWEPAAAPEEEPPAPGDPEAARRLLYDLLAALPDKDRLTLTLVYLEDCSREELAERLGIGRAAVAMRVFKAKLKLKRLAKRKNWRERVKWLIS